MKLLLADGDRDVLLSFEHLLTMAGHTVITAFDGARVIDCFNEDKPDLLILGEELPDAVHQRLISLYQGAGIPVLVLLRSKPEMSVYLRDPLAQAYLPFPFLPGELLEVVEGVMKMKESHETLSWGGPEVDVSGFCFKGTGNRLCYGEIRLLEDLKEGHAPEGRRSRMLIHSLNRKLKSYEKPCMIRYQAEKGYVVANNE